MDTYINNLNQFKEINNNGPKNLKGGSAGCGYRVEALSQDARSKSKLPKSRPMSNKIGKKSWML